MSNTDKNDPLLVANKNVFGAENVLGSDNTLEVAIPATLEIYYIATTLEVYNNPGNTLEVSSFSTTDNTLEVYHMPGNMLEVYNIPNTRDNFSGILIHALVVLTG